MPETIIIAGRIKDGVFLPDEPLPHVTGAARLVVTPEGRRQDSSRPKSILDFFGASPEKRTAREIDEELERERESWGGRDGLP